MDVYEAEATHWPSSTYLYALPLDFESRVLLENSPSYNWSLNGQYFYRNEPGNVMEGHLPSQIVIFNAKGDSIRTIENGIGIDPGLRYFMRDTDSNGNLIAPRLMSYDLGEDQSREIVVFPDSLTLWPFGFPDVLEPIQHPVELCGGVMLVLYHQPAHSHDARSRQAYTFFVYQNKILMSREGDRRRLCSFKDEACKMIQNLHSNKK